MAAAYLDPMSIPLVQRVPELFTQTYVDPKIRVRTRPMKLIVIGLPRTGTMSTRMALDRLGYRVHHMLSILHNPKDAVMWREAYEEKFGSGTPGKCTFTREQWDMLLGDFDACMDFPSAAFVPELIEAYPEAKVIVCQRDPEKWYHSVSSTVLRIPKFGVAWPILLDSSTRPAMLLVQSYAKAWDQAGGKEGMIKRYKEMYDEARTVVPQERRLEWSLGDGWGPMCAFLDKPAPEDEPFPHVNDSGEFHLTVGMVSKRSYDRLVESAVKWTAIGVAAVLLCERFVYPHM